MAGSHPNVFQLKGDATKGGERSELGSPGSGVCIYHDASPGVWRLLTAPGHVSRGERGEDRRREDVEARLRWGMGRGGWDWGRPAPQPAGGRAATSAEPHSRGGGGAAVEQRLMHLSALQGASLAARCLCLCRLRTPRGYGTVLERMQPLVICSPHPTPKPIAAAPRPAISKTPPCQVLNAHLSQVKA